MISILNRFFILVGGIVLSLVSFYKNISVKDIFKKRESKNNDVIEAIFSKLDYETNPKIPKMEKDVLEDIRQRLKPVMMKKSSIKFVILLTVLLFIIRPFEVGGMFLTVVVMFYIFQD